MADPESSPEAVAEDSASDETEPATHSTRLTPEQLVFFNRQLASMARLNMPIARGLEVMGEEVSDADFRELIQGVQQDLTEGRSLEEALSRYPRTFNRIYIELMKAGESTGNLAVVLDQIAEYSETMYDVRTSIRNALSYPLLIGGVTVAFLAYFFIFAVPRFQMAFQNLAQIAPGEIPFLTRVLIGVSQVIRIPVISVPVLGMLVILGGYAAWRMNRGIDRYDQFMFHIPIFGRLFRKAALHKTCRTLRDLMVNGVSLVQSLDLTSRVVGENEIRTRLELMRGEVEEGRDFSQVLQEAEDVFPQTMVWKLQMGHERGVIEETFGELAREHTRDIDSVTRSITRVIGPVLLMFIAGVVGLLFAGFYPPLLKIMSRTPQAFVGLLVAAFVLPPFELPSRPPR